MLNLFIAAIIVLLISLVVMSLASFLSKKSINDREKSSPFECGFDPLNTSRIPFSMQFFLIAIIFLIFDVEIALILPMIMILKASNILSWSLTSLIFIVILLAGLFHEWNQGSLNWTQ